MPGMIDEIVRTDLQPADTSSIIRYSASKVLLVDDCTMTRECLFLMLLSRCGDSFEVDSVAKVHDATKWTPDLALLNARSANAGEHQMVEQAQSVRRIFPDAALAIIAERDDHQSMLEALKQGYRAYITTEMTSKLVIAAINVVLAGGIFVPSMIIEHCLEALPVKASNLTPKETEIMSHVIQGKSNKAIARDLHSSVNTVKLHVHNIMRKLGATSRTELVANVYANKRDQREIDD